MQTDLPSLRTHQPQTFRYSLDWRFLLPVADAGRIRVVAEEDAELRTTLEQVGIPVSNLLTCSNGAGDEKKDIQSFALPLGLPARWVDTKVEDQIEFCRSLRRLMGPDGYILVGFNNVWNIHKKTASKYHPSTPRLMKHQLLQAGFRSVRLFGALPNLSIPEYIFDLEAGAVRFALHHRFRRKRVVLRALRALTQTVSIDRISQYLPCYFAVAAV